MLAVIIGTVLAMNLVWRHGLPSCETSQPHQVPEPCQTTQSYWDSEPCQPAQPYQAPAPCQTPYEWWIAVINAAIYWGFYDALSIAQAILQLWLNIKNPVIKLVAVSGSVTITLNVTITIKRWLWNDKMSLFCPIDATPGKPIPGTYNRYRCSEGHQFNGDPHGIH